MDFPGRLIAGLLVVVLIVMFPLQYMAHLSNESIDALVDDRTRQFSDSIRVKGYLDKYMYEEYLDYLDSTGERYDIELQDILPVRGEEHSFRDNDKTTQTASFERVSYNEIQSYKSHTHSGACYAGDIHVCDGTGCEYENNVQKILVGVGRFPYNSNSYIYYSYDGIAWRSPANNLISSSSIEITYMNGQFVVSDFSGSPVKVSLDGINWTYINTKINESSVSDITYNTASQTIKDFIDGGNGYYYACGTGTRYEGGKAYSIGVIFRSTDLSNWNYYKHYDRIITKLGVSKEGEQKTIVALAQGNPSLDILAGCYTGYINDDGTISNMSFSNGHSYTGSIRQVGDYAVVTYGAQYVGDLKYGKGTYLSFGINTYNNMINSLNRGDSINNMRSVTGHNLDLNIVSNTMVYFGDQFIISGNKQTGPNSTSFYTFSSIDGTTWTQRYAPAAFYELACNAEGGSGEIDRGPCSKEGKYYNNTGAEVSPICDRVVTSIRAKYPTQSVDKGNSINTTAIATYLDGHEGEVSCSSNFNPNIVGVQTVTLTYSGLVGNAKTTGVRTCTISVTVRAVNILTSITVLPVSQKVQKYSFSSFTVSANYDDGTSKILSASEYSVSGFNSKYIGLQSVSISYSEGGVIKRATVSVTVTALLKECPRCKQVYELNPDDTDPGCPKCRELIIGIEVSPDFVELTKGDALPITVMGLYNDGSKDLVTGWDSNYNPERIGLQIVTITYRGYAAEISVWVNERNIKCPVCNTKYQESEDSCPVCVERVIRIEASPKDLTIMQYEPINLNVIAYYADGSNREVEDWAIDSTSFTPGAFQATVSYRGVSDIISLTVLSINSIECPICGIIYDISESPKGCPICSEEIVGIEAYLTSGTNLVQLGTTPNIAIIIIYRDEHREFANEGNTLEGFDAHRLGIQTVTIRYKGFTTTIIIEVVNILDAITCPNGHVYHKNSDGTDPGCPFCHSDSEGSNIVYFDITYTTEILDTLYSIGIYHFQEGNYISVIVNKKDKSLMYRLQNTFFSTSTLGRKERFIYGGEIG